MKDSELSLRVALWLAASCERVYDAMATQDFQFKFVQIFQTIG